MLVAGGCGERGEEAAFTKEVHPKTGHLPCTHVVVTRDFERRVEEVFADCYIHRDSLWEFPRDVDGNREFVASWGA